MNAINEIFFGNQGLASTSVSHLAAIVATIGKSSRLKIKMSEALQETYERLNRLEE